MNRRVISLVAASVACGALLATNPPAAILAVLAMIVALLWNRDYRLTIAAFMVFVMMVPTGWGIERVLPLAMRIGPISLNLVVIGVVLAGMLVGLNQVMRSGQDSALRDVGASRHVSVLAAAASIALAVGVIAHGAGDALRDAQYVAVMIAGIVLAESATRHLDAAERVRVAVDSLLIAMTVYSIAMLVLYVSPAGVRDLVYDPSGMWTGARTTRVGFGNSKLLVLAIPLCLWDGVPGSIVRQGSTRVIMCLLMIGAVYVSQGRLLMLAVAGAVLSVVWLRSSDSRPVARRLIATGIVGLMIALVVSAAGIPMAASTLQRSAVELQTRITTLASGVDASATGRYWSSAAAYTRWWESPFIGEGYGAELILYSSDGVPLQAGPFIDDAPATLLVKGGLLLLLAYAYVLAAPLYRLRRLAKSHQSPVVSQYAAIVLRCMPWFLVVAVGASVHAIMVPSVVVGWAWLTRVAGCSLES